MKAPQAHDDQVKSLRPHKYAQLKSCEASCSAGLVPGCSQAAFQQALC